VVDHVPPGPKPRNANRINEDAAVRINQLLATVFATALCASSTGSTAAAQGPTPVRVEAKGETMTVDADNVPLKDVLDQLQEQAGFVLIETADALQSPVTITLDDVPWRGGLAKLLRGFRYALAMNPETKQPARLVILSSEGSAASASPGDGETATPVGTPATGGAVHGSQAPDRAVSSLEEATRIANELIAQRENPLQFAMRKAREAAAEAEAARKASESEAGGGQTQDRDRRYAESLRALGQFQDPERLEVLAPALGSDSKDVRTAALEALRDGTVNDDAVLDQVRSMATGDADPYVQRDALEVYVRYGDQSDVLSLVQSLGRTSGPTRDIAVREWLRLEKERAEAALPDQQLQSARR
jgi:hypothetical protein